jgi:hypothetical protein
MQDVERLPRLSYSKATLYALSQLPVMYVRYTDLTRLRVKSKQSSGMKWADMTPRMHSLP